MFSAFLFLGLVSPTCAANVSACTGDVDFCARSNQHDDLSTLAVNLKRHGVKTSGDDRLLRQTPMLRSHDAATFFAGTPLIKAQFSSFREQLDCGARAFDIRLVLDGNGHSRFQHCPGAGADILANICILGDQDVEKEMSAFEGFIRDNPDELVVIDISHCLISQFAHWEDITCLTPKLMDQFRNRNWAILTDWKDCDQGQCLETLTVGQAKLFAKEGKISGQTVPKHDDSKERQAGIIVVTNYQNELVNPHFEGDVHNDWGAMQAYTQGYLGLGDKWKTPSWGPDFANDADKVAIQNRLQTYQGHWQASGPGGMSAVPGDVQDGKSLNLWIADPNEPVMQNMASGKINMVEMNWVCDEGSKKVGEAFLKFAKDGASKS